MGLVRILLIFLGIYLLFRIIVRYVLPLIVRKTVQKVADRFDEQQATRNSGQKVYEHNDVVIRKPSAKRGQGNSDGEYVDFEEVKD